MKILLSILGWLLSAGLAGAETSPRELQKLARHSVDFFPPGKSCAVHLTFVGWDGKPVAKPGGGVRTERALVATSRMAYGLAKAADLHRASDAGVAAAYLARAEKYADFLLAHFVKRDEDGPYFVRAVDEPAPAWSPTDDSAVLNVEQQAYGLSGLVALHRETKSPKLAKAIHELYGAFFKRFHDPIHLGFFDQYDRKARKPVRNDKLGIVPKSFNSTAYVLSAFLFEMGGQVALEHADYPPPRDTGLEVGRLMAKHFFDPKTGWIVENFSEDWREVWHGWQKQNEGTIASVGHNFQAAWLMLQLAERVGVKTEDGVALFGAASQILKRQMNDLPGIDRVYGGFFNTFVRETNQPIWACTDQEGANAGQSYKHWWQQVFGLLALSLGRNLGVFDANELAQVQTFLDRSFDFYRAKFVDTIHGGEFFSVKRDGSPVYAGDESLKGAPGKSAHHSLQLYWYLNQYEYSPRYAPRLKEAPGPIGSAAWKTWYYDPPAVVDWYPGKHISGHLGGSPRRSDYPELFGPAE